MKDELVEIILAEGDIRYSFSILADINSGDYKIRT